MQLPASRFAELLFMGGHIANNVAHADRSNYSALAIDLVDHNQSLYPQSSQRCYRSGDCGIRRTADNLRCHQVAGIQAGKLLFGAALASEYEVCLADNTNRRSILDNNHRADSRPCRRP